MRPAKLWRQTILLGGWWLLAAVSYGQSTLLPESSTLRNAVFPVYETHATEPCSLISVQHLHHDFQTRAFFRIGVLPALRAERVEFVIRDPDRLAEILARVRPIFLSKGSRQSFEMREVVFRIEGESLPRLAASRIRLTESGDWDLVDGCQLQENGATIRLPRSRLTVAGSDAGAVRNATDGEIRVFHPFQFTDTQEEQQP